MRVRLLKSSLPDLLLHLTTVKGYLISGPVDHCTLARLNVLLLLRQFNKLHQAEGVRMENVQ